MLFRLYNDVMLCFWSFSPFSKGAGLVGKEGGGERLLHRGNNAFFHPCVFAFEKIFCDFIGLFVVVIC